MSGEEYFEYSPEGKRPLESDFEIAGLILSVKAKIGHDKVVVEVKDKETGKKTIKVLPKPNPFYEIFDEDMTISNLSPIEHALVKDHVNLSNFTQSVSVGIGVDLSQAQTFYARQLKGTLLSSRGKGGWAGMLSKTDKSISEQSLMSYQKQMAEERKQGFLKKIFGGKKE